MTSRAEIRARCNPNNLSITDVMLGEGRLEPGMLLINQRRTRGAARWSRMQCCLLLAAVGAAVILLLVVSIR